MYGSSSATADLHHRRRLQHERQLHLPGAEQLAHGLHAVEQVVVDDVQRGVLRPCLVERAVEALLLAVDDVLAQAFFQRQRREVFLRRRGGRAVGEEVDEDLQRVARREPSASVTHLPGRRL
jgi:hypothetical protein